MTIKGYNVGTLLKKTGSEILEDNVLGLAAQAAYSFFFSLFPILLFLAPLFSLIGNKRQIVTTILNRLSMTLPTEAYVLLQNIVRDVVFGKNAPGLMSVGLILAAFSGSSVIDTMIGALNTAYDVTDPRPWWKRRLLALLFTLGAAVVVGTGTVIMLAGPVIVDFLSAQLGLSSYAATMWSIVQYPLAFLLLVGFLWLIYYFLPHVHQKKSHVAVGAFVAVILWILLTLGFRFYVAHFGSYNKTYGTIGAVIILLTWMYLTMVVLLSAGELASELHCGTGLVKKGATRQHVESAPRRLARQA